MALILIVEDEQDLATLIKRQLESEGHQVLIANDGQSALLLAESKPDMVILDWMLPRMDGLTVCRKLRDRSAVPILMLTARGEETDRVLGLEIGADDYITKPFSMRELMARIHANLRRVEMLRATESIHPGPVRVGKLTIDPVQRRVEADGVAVELTVKEYELLLLLARHAGRTFSRTYLIDRVWGDSYEGGDRSVDAQVVRLRRKLGAAGGQIATVWGVGYRLEE
ncbi:MAG: two-component system, OmpR family, response regulator VicR [Chloroflexia bacterium]|nr:two-component system, OmpR family, response regulator VicR [Chloroflexia bacterium]